MAALSCIRPALGCVVQAGNSPVTRALYWGGFVQFALALLMRLLPHDRVVVLLAASLALPFAQCRNEAIWPSMICARGTV
jgi:hypothetical protein